MTSEANPWRDAILNELTTLHLLTEEHEQDPAKALQTLLQFTQDIALDPAVCSDAQKLVYQGRREGIERAIALVRYIRNNAQLAYLKTSGVKQHARFQAVDYVVEELQSISEVPPFSPVATDDVVRHLWAQATLELCSYENCYIRGFRDAEQYHSVNLYAQIKENTHVQQGREQSDQPPPDRSLA